MLRLRLYILLMVCAVNKLSILEKKKKEILLCPLLQMYVTCTVQAKGTRLAKPVLSLGLMCLAFLTGLNRVAEYRNHWSDVIAGFLIGTAIATFLVRIPAVDVVRCAACLHRRSVSIHTTTRKAADGSNGLHMLCTHGDKRDMNPQLVIRDFFLGLFSP